MIRHIILLSFVMVFAGCERSARNVEIQRKDEAIKQPDNDGGGDSTSKTGRVEIAVTGLPSSASSANILVNIDGSSEPREFSLQSGAGSATIYGVSQGSVFIKLSTTIAGVTYTGSGKATVKSGSTVTAKIQMSGGGSTPGGDTQQPQQPTPQQPTPQQPTPQQPTPNPQTGTPNGDNSDVKIEVEIGSGSPGSNQQNLWDGKSFKGNSMFSIEPVK